MLPFKWIRFVWFAHLIEESLISIALCSCFVKSFSNFSRSFSTETNVPGLFLHFSKAPAAPLDSLFSIPHPLPPCQLFFSEFSNFFICSAGYAQFSSKLKEKALYFLHTKPFLHINEGIIGECPMVWLKKTSKKRLLYVRSWCRKTPRVSTFFASEH